MNIRSVVKNLDSRAQMLFQMEKDLEQQSDPNNLKSEPDSGDVAHMDSNFFLIMTSVSE